MPSFGERLRAIDSKRQNERLADLREEEKKDQLRIQENLALIEVEKKLHKKADSLFKPILQEVNRNILHGEGEIIYDQEVYGSYEDDGKKVLSPHRDKNVSFSIKWGVREIYNWGTKSELKIYDHGLGLVLSDTDEICVKGGNVHTSPTIDRKDEKWKTLVEEEIIKIFEKGWFRYESHESNYEPGGMN